MCQAAPLSARADPARSRVSDSFAPNARRLCGIASRLLGWRMAEFWETTPTELAMALDPADPVGCPPNRDEILRMMERDNG